MAFEALKGFFFEEDPDSKKKPQTETPVKGTGQTSFTRRLPELDSAASQTNQTIHEDTSFVPAVTKKSVLDERKLVAHFDEVIAGSLGAPPNYYTFSQMLLEMGDIPEAAKIKGAFAALKSQGVTKQSLINSANQCLGVLDKDYQAFKNEALQSQNESRNQIQSVNNLVQNNNSEISRITQETEKQIKQLMEARDMKIRQLNSEIDQSKKKIAPLEEEAARITDKVEAFGNACENYKGVIMNDINKINTYLQ